MLRLRLIELDKNIRPGMSCDADIKTETRKDVFTVPIQSVTARIPKKSDVLDDDEIVLQLQKKGKKN